MVHPNGVQGRCHLFFTQVLLHHFDNIDEIIADGTIDNEFNAYTIFLDKEYWLYPVVSEVGMEDGSC
jgi:hypothetical protein